jgi:hypothetical protein
VKRSVTPGLDKLEGNMRASSLSTLRLDPG